MVTLLPDRHRSSRDSSSDSEEGHHHHPPQPHHRGRGSRRNALGRLTTDPSESSSEEEEDNEEDDEVTTPAGRHNSFAGFLALEDSDSSSSSEEEEEEDDDNTDDKNEKDSLQQQQQQQCQQEKTRLADWEASSSDSDSASASDSDSDSASDSDSDSGSESASTQTAGAGSETVSTFADLIGRCTRQGGQPLPVELVAALEASIRDRQPSEQPSSRSTLPHTVRPTRIQQQVWTTLFSPATSDRDVVAISKTGSGKTLAYLVPVFASLLSTPHPVPTTTTNTNTTTTTTTTNNTTTNTTTTVAPRAIILAPTRVLAVQLYAVATTLVRTTASFHHHPHNSVHVGLAVGGIGYQQQLADLRAHPPDLLIATPGRLTALCGKSAENTNPQQKPDDKETETADRCITFDQVRELVLDEADLMLSSGFHDELTWLAQVLQTESTNGFRVVLTSATWDTDTSTQAVAQFASRSSVAPVVLRAEEERNGQKKKNETTTTGRRPSHHGGLMVSTTVTQQVEVIGQKGAPRFKRLCTLLEAALRQTSSRNGRSQTTIDAEESSRSRHDDDVDDDNRTRIIVFCLQKAQARQIGNALKQKISMITTILILEGDMSQAARAAAVDAFRRGGSGSGAGVVLVATDVAARGLDCHVAHVVNYSVGLSLAGYVHRCGRTGRAGRYGISTTFVVKGIDDHLTPELVCLLRHAQQRVVDDLRILAAKELQRRRQQQQRRGKPGEPTTNSGSQNRNNTNNDDDEEDIAEVRRANREKQLRLNQQRQRSSKQQQKRRGKR